MIKNLKHIMLLTCFLTLLHCTSDSSKKKINYPEFSNELCKCAQPSIKLNDEMMALQKQGKSSELKALMPKAGETYKKVLECANNYIFLKAYKEFQPNMLNAELGKNCPNMPKKMISELLHKTKFE